MRHTHCSRSRNPVQIHLLTYMMINLVLLGQASFWIWQIVGKVVQALELPMKVEYSSHTNPGRYSECLCMIKCCLDRSTRSWNLSFYKNKEFLANFATKVYNSILKVFRGQLGSSSHSNTVRNYVRQMISQSYSKTRVWNCSVILIVGSLWHLTKLGIGSWNLLCRHLDKFHNSIRFYKLL